MSDMGMDESQKDVLISRLREQVVRQEKDHKNLLYNFRLLRMEHKALEKKYDESLIKLDHARAQLKVDEYKVRNMKAELEYMKRQHDGHIQWLTSHVSEVDVGMHLRSLLAQL
jgi:hypothetical protein